MDSYSKFVNLMVNYYGKKIMSVSLVHALNIHKYRNTVFYFLVSQFEEASLSTISTQLFFCKLIFKRWEINYVYYKELVH
jgi:hypothetical protein